MIHIINGQLSGLTQYRILLTRSRYQYPSDSAAYWCWLRQTQTQQQRRRIVTWHVKQDQSLDRNHSKRMWVEHGGELSRYDV